MLKVPTCEDCTNFDYDGCKCDKYPDGVPSEIIFLPLEELRQKCDQFEEGKM